MTHTPDLVDVNTGDRFHQPTPYGLVYPVSSSDTAPTGQRGRTWEHHAASGRELRPADETRA